MTHARLVGFVFALAILQPCFARETVYLKSGFSFEADSHVPQNGTMLFRMGAGTLEFPSDAISRIETLPGPDVRQAEVTATPAEAQSPVVILSQAAYLQGVDEDFVRSVAKVESGLREEAVSRKGALGLMQLMPATAAELGVRANEPLDNAKGGAKYLRELLIRYHGNSVLALAAYNAGPEAVAKYGGVPPYPETRRYVLLVLREYNRQLKNKAKSVPSAITASK